MQHHGDRNFGAAGNLAKAAGDCFQALAPTFPPVAGYEHAPLFALPLRRPWQQRQTVEQSIDGGVARDDDLPASAFPAKVGGIQLRGSKQEVSLRIDRDAEVFLGPRV